MSTHFVRADGHPIIVVAKSDYFTRLHLRLQNRLPCWVVYRPGTREYPSHWVARMHIQIPVAKPTRFVLSHDSLEELRDLLPPGLTMLGRAVLDPVKIEEVWI
jgi:hypothetical protein